MSPKVKIFFKKKIIPSQKMTQRIEPLFVCFNNDSKNWTLCKWLIELSLFHEPLLNKSWIFLFLTQRIELFFEYDSINRTHFFMWLKNWNFRLKKSKMKLFNFLKTQNWFFSHDSKNWTRLFQHDSENWTFFEIDSKFFKWTRRIEPFFFSIRLNESNLFKMWLSL